MTYTSKLACTSDGTAQRGTSSRPLSSSPSSSAQSVRISTIPLTRPHDHTSTRQLNRPGPAIHHISVSHPSAPLTPDLAVKISGALSQSTSATKSSLSSRGVTYQNGKLSVKTDRAAPSREEYIAQTQRAFEKGARTMSLHPDAFRTGKSREASAEPVAVPVAAAPVASSSSHETP